MSINKSSTRINLISACVLFVFIFAYLNHLDNYNTKTQAIRKQTVANTVNQSTSDNGNYTSNINISGQRTYKPNNITYINKTYEISRWVTSGDWSHDDEELTVTVQVPVICYDDYSIDYVEDNWDSFLDDPEDEILYDPWLFQ